MNRGTLAKGESGNKSMGLHDQQVRMRTYVEGIRGQDIKGRLWELSRGFNLELQLVEEKGLLNKRVYVTARGLKDNIAGYVKAIKSYVQAEGGFVEW